MDWQRQILQLISPQNQRRQKEVFYDVATLTDIPMDAYGEMEEVG